MQSGVTRSRLAAASFIVIAAIIISALVLNVRTSPHTPTTASTSSAYTQTSTTTKFVYTDILSQGNQSASIAARVNEVFIIHLAANSGSTGYDWNVSTSSGVRFIGYTTTHAGTLPGAPTERDYRFQALAPGAATITLVYGRLPPAFSVPQIAETIRVSVEITT